MAGLFERLQGEISRRDAEPGISPLDLLDMSPELQAIVQLLARRGALSAAEVAESVGLPAEEVTSLLDGLVEKGSAKAEDTPPPRRYRVKFGQRRAREVPLGIWAALSEQVDPPSEDG